MNMDELEKKAQKGLESFSKKGDIESVKTSLDGLTDDMLGDDDEISIDGKSNGYSLKWVFIALAIIGLGIIGYLGFKNANQQKEIQTPKAVYAQYFEVLPDAMSANERGDSKDVEVVSDGVIGMKYYNEGEFKKAALILKRQDESGFLLFAAISEMKNDNSASAIKLFLESKNMDVNNQYGDIIDWYLSLAYLKENKSDLAKKILTEISNEKHYKKEEAASILEVLN